MKLHNRTQDEKMPAIDWCFFDAQNSRISLALLRIDDLKNEFPGDAQIIYAEGLIRKDYLGQGIKAGSLFREAYSIDNSHSFAACNATLFSTNEQEFFKWAGIALSTDPNDKSLKQLVISTRENLMSEMSYGDLMIRASQQHLEAKEFGVSAAFAEIALQTENISLEHVGNWRRVRAQCLRSLDDIAHRYRRTINESFPPDERLALLEALAELDKAISIEEYDAELWNLKSAWKILMQENEAALHCADKAIELRPYSYAKPWHNKGKALWNLVKKEEALEWARQSLKHAESAESIADIKMSNDMIKDYSTKQKTATLMVLKPLIKHILKAAHITSDLELGQMAKSVKFSGRNPVKMLANGIELRAMKLKENYSPGYVLIFSEFLSGFSPETTYIALSRICDRSKDIYINFIHSALYVACHSRGSMQRDALRFLILTIFGAGGADAVRTAYREVILEPAATAVNAWSDLDKIMRQELQRILILFPKLIADQEPISQKEIERAKSNILSKFQDNPEINPDFTKEDFNYTTRILSNATEVKEKYSRMIARLIKYIFWVVFILGWHFNYSQFAWYFIIPIAFISGVIVEAIVSSLIDMI